LSGGRWKAESSSIEKVYTQGESQGAQSDAQPHAPNNGHPIHNGTDAAPIYAYSRFKSKLDNTPKAARHTWPQLCEGLSRRAIREEKDGAAFSGASYPPDTPRGNEGVSFVSVAILDFDDGTTLEEIEAGAARLNSGDGGAAFIYSTHSHNPNEGALKYRLVLPLLEPVAACDWPRAWKRLALHFGGAPDEKAKDAARIHFLPSCPKEREIFAVALELDGAPLDVATLPQLPPDGSGTDDTPPEAREMPVLAFPDARGDNYARKAFESEIGRLCATTGNRNDALNCTARRLGQFIGAGRLDRAEVEAALLNAPRVNGYIEKDGEAEARRTIKSGLDAGEREPNRKGMPEDRGRSASIRTQGEREPRDEKPKRAPSVGLTAAQLLDADFPEPKWIVPGFLPEGSTVLAGHPKLGKSWLSFGLAVAVACGGYAFGSIQVEAGDVLYLALEDNPRRMKSRLQKILQGDRPEGLEKLNVFHEWERLDEGGLLRLDAWLGEHPSARLVIIDTFQKVKPRARAGGNSYETDYDAAAPLNQLAAKWGVSIVCVHHLRKSDSVDDVEAVSGSYGITGAADAIIGLRRMRGQCDAVLSITGRDVEEAEHALKWQADFGAWQLLGDAQEFRLTGERAEVVKALRDCGEPVSPKTLWESVRVGKSLTNLKTMLWRMAKDGEAISEKGKYRLPESEKPSNPSNPSNRSNPSNPTLPDMDLTPIKERVSSVAAASEPYGADNLVTPVTGADASVTQGYSVTPVTQLPQLLFATDPTREAKIAELAREAPPSSCTVCGKPEPRGNYHLSLDGEKLRAECARCTALLSDAPTPDTGALDDAAGVDIE